MPNVGDAVQTGLIMNFPIWGSEKKNVMTEILLVKQPKILRITFRKIITTTEILC